LACIDSMVMEHLFSNIWNRGWLHARFRDDITVIAPTRLNDKEVQEHLAKLNWLYGPDLKVVLEEVSYSSLNFLDTTIFHDNLGIQTKYYNKNAVIDCRKN